MNAPFQPGKGKTMKRLAILLSLTTMLATPAFAQSKAELAAQDARLAQRLTVLEQRFLTGDPAAAQLMQRMDQMETTMRNLTGEVETLRYERDALRREVEALAGDVRAMQELKQRMEIHLQAVDMVSQGGARPAPVAQPQTSTGLPPAGMPPFGSVVQPGTSVPGTQVTTPAVDLDQLPDTGRRLLAEGNFAGAQDAFAQYLQAKPTALDAGDVSYWLGESHFVRGQYADAADAYIQSMRSAAQGPKAPEAMVRLGAALRELGKTSQACATLKSFPGQYPNADRSVREKARVETARTGC